MGHNLPLAEIVNAAESGRLALLADKVLIAAGDIVAMRSTMPGTLKTPYLANASLNFRA